MNVVHVVIGGHVAGGQLVALRLARAARERGHTVSFVSPTHGPFLDLVASEGMEVRVVPVAGALDARAILRLRREFRASGASIVHTHVHFSLNVAARLAAQLAGARVIAHMHIENTFRSGRAARAAQVALDNATARLCKWIVAVSDATRASLLAQGYPAKRTVTIHNGIEPQASAAPADLGDGRHVLEVGRLCEAKGQLQLVRALAQLPDDVVAVLAGEDVESDGAYEALLEREARTLAVADRVRFLGHRDDVPSLIAAADLVVLPSLVEGLPLVLLEAMAQAKPVVATAVGGTPELVGDGETGVLVAPGDDAALADAIAALLAEPERARRLGEAGARVVRDRFDAEDAVARVLELYERSR